MKTMQTEAEEMGNLAVVLASEHNNGPLNWLFGIALIGGIFYWMHWSSQKKQAEDQRFGETLVRAGTWALSQQHLRVDDRAISTSQIVEVADQDDASKRFTATRLVALGPLGLAFKKDTGNVYLFVELDDGELVAGKFAAKEREAAYEMAARLRAIARRNARPEDDAGG